MRLNMHVIHQTFAHYTNWITRSWINFNSIEYTITILISSIHFSCTSNRFDESENGIKMNSHTPIHLNLPQSVFFTGKTFCENGQNRAMRYHQCDGKTDPRPHGGNFKTICFIVYDRKKSRQLSSNVNERVLKITLSGQLST